MVATVVRLRVALLRHTLRREVWRVVMLALGMVWVLAAMPSLVGGTLWLARQPVDVTEPALVVVGSLLVAGWAVVPLLVPGLDDSLDVGRFAGLGVPARRLVPGLLAAAFLGLPTLVVAAVCLLPVLAWWGAGGPAAALVALAAAPAALGTCLLAARISTSGARRAMGSRRGRELAGVGAVAALGLGVPAVATLGGLGLERAVEGVPRLTAVLGWTPLGLPWSAPAAMAAGRPVEAVVRLGLAALVVAAALAAWTRLVHAELVRPVARGGRERRTLDVVLPVRVRPTTATGLATWAVTRRCLRSWRSDPRYLTSLLGAVVAPVVIVLLAAAVVEVPAAVVASVGVLMAGSIGWGRHNDVAFDGSAFWMHLAARVPGRADRAGRAVATLVWAVPLVVVAGVVGAVLGGRGDLAPAAAGAAVGVLGAGLGVSAVASAVLPYPVPEAGANPFSAPAGAIGASLVAQAVSTAVTGLVALPAVATLALAFWLDARWALPALAVGLATAAGSLAVGVLLGGRLLDRRAPALFARLR